MDAAETERLQVNRLDAPFGVEIRGLSWGVPDTDSVQSLTRLLRRHLLLIFRGQASPTHDQLDAFFRPFGRLVSETLDGTFHYNSFQSDEAVMVHRRGEFNYVVNTPEGASELTWHNDHFQRPQIKIMSVLEGLEAEPGAVPTCYRDMYTAYEMLPAELRASLEYKQTVNFDPRRMDLVKEPRLCDSMHLVFTPHPHSGRRALYVNGFTARIAGLDQAVSDELLAILRAHAEQNAPQYHHHWKAGDLLVWDNVGVQHRRDALPQGQVRRLRVFEGVAE